MPYTRPYSGGFVDYPSTTTPINSTALNTMDVGIKTANDQFQTVTTAQRTALSPTVGQCVWDSDLRQLMVFMNASGGNAWQPIGNAIVCTSTTRPSTPFEGQVIRETDTNKELTYSGSAWVQTNSWGTTSGVTGVNNLIVPPAVRCTQSAVQSIPHNTSTAVAFDGADLYDTDDMHSPTVNNSRITINTDGIYAVSGTFAWNGAPTVRFHLQIAVNGSITAAYNFPIDISTGTQAVALNINTMYSFVAGNYVQLLVFQGSGGAAKNSDPGLCNFSATWIGRTS